MHRRFREHMKKIGVQVKTGTFDDDYIPPRPFLKVSYDMEAIRAALEKAAKNLGTAIDFAINELKKALYFRQTPKVIPRQKNIGLRKKRRWNRRKGGKNG